MRCLNCGGVLSPTLCTSQEVHDERPRDYNDKTKAWDGVQVEVHLSCLSCHAVHILRIDALDSKMALNTTKTVDFLQQSI